MTRTNSMTCSGIALAMLVGGCSTSQVSPVQFASRMVPGSEPSKLFASAKLALTNLGYRLDQVDINSGVITTEPTNIDRNVRSAQGRTTLSSAGQGRRFVEVRLVRGATGTRVHCRVRIQVLSTQAYRLFGREASGADVPNETPIDFDAASSVKQNTVWKTTQRDRSAERQILDAIVRQAGR